jgi:Flp pilus assembly protein TadB
MMSFWWSVCFSAGGCVLLAWSSRWAKGRALHITEALLEESVGQDSVVAARGSGSDEAKYQSVRRRAWLVGAVLVTIGHGLFAGFSVVGSAIFAAIGVLAGELFSSRWRERGKNLHLRQLEFYLPAAMERVVLGVAAGLDIVPALREASQESKDPVSSILQRIVSLCESGVPVESAFEIASQQVASVSVKHACIHLALAHKRGGEIVRPLKELSDATMIAYQETVEERIAKLPVQAVLPLVITFAGLIVCFLTIPLIQVSSITKRVMHVAGSEK